MRACRGRVCAPHLSCLSKPERADSKGSATPAQGPTRAKSGRGRRACLSLRLSDCSGRRAVRPCAPAAAGHSGYRSRRLSALGGTGHRFAKRRSCNAEAKLGAAAMRRGLQPLQGREIELDTAFRRAPGVGYGHGGHVAGSVVKGYGSPWKAFRSRNTSAMFTTSFKQGSVLLTA